MDLDKAEIEAFKRRWAKMGQAQELPEDIEPYGEARAQRLAAINARRAEAGRPALVNDEEGNPALTERRRRRNAEYDRQQRERSQGRPKRSVRR